MRVALQPHIAGVHEQRQLTGHDLQRLVLQARVGQGPEAVAARIQPRSHAQPVQGLREFERNHPGPEHGHRFGQVLPIEDIVVDDQPLARRRAPGRRHVRRRAGGDDDALRVHAGVPVHLQGVRVEEAGLADQPMLGRPVRYRVGDEADESIALAAHALHNLRPGYAQQRRMHPEGVGMGHRMRCFGRGDQQLARHAAHARAGCAVGATLDDQHIRRVRQRGAIGRHARRTRTDDGDVDFTDVHAHALGEPGMAAHHHARRRLVAASTFAPSVSHAEEAAAASTWATMKLRSSPKLSGHSVKIGAGNMGTS